MMAIMYPKNISEYIPTDSERIVYHELKNQLPDSYEVFYSVKWTSFTKDKLIKSEADFIVVSPEYGFLCLEVKGGSGIRIEDNIWYVEDAMHGDRRLKLSPYDQAEKSMYYFEKTFSDKYNMKYQGIYASAVLLPFYSIGQDLHLDHRQRICTIDNQDLNHLYDRIKKIFRLLGGESFGRRFYPKSQNDAFLELIRERIAISAAAGALVKYKNQQLDIINRVQDNYIYFLSNVRQFYIRGGAGTGKTWIAMKMAETEAAVSNQKVLYICASVKLAQKVKEYITKPIDVLDVGSLFFKLAPSYNCAGNRQYAGIASAIAVHDIQYDAIFVDEAQDFTQEWAQVIKSILVHPLESRLGVFYDDVQIIRDSSFGNGFGISGLPFLLHENIRNTANIYNWTAQKTQLGTDMIANPVEGPTPTSEFVYESGQLTLVLESLFRKYLVEEYLPNDSLAVITDDIDWFLQSYPTGIARWCFVRHKPALQNQIALYSIEDYKGLEADMVVYLHKPSSTENMNYIAYTRAKYYLIEIVRMY